MLAATAWVVASSALLPVRDTPLGSDWPRYLGNAAAIGTRQWDDYQAWRAPLHALVCLALTRFGHLLEASQAVSMASVGVVVLASAALGRRALGRGGGALVAVLLAGWPDLALQGRMSTPYPLLAALVATALLAADAGAARSRGGLASGGLLALAAVAAGLAGATDARGLALCGAAFAGTAVASVTATRLAPGRARRALVVCAGLGAAACGAFALHAAITSQVPVNLFTLGEQVALQRDLHAREGHVPGCFDHHGAAVQLSELWSACARRTGVMNLLRLAPMSPLPALFALGVALLGLRWRLAAPACMLLALVPGTLLVGMEHRYLLPVAGPVAVLFASGALRVGGWLDRVTDGGRGTLAAGVALAAAFALGWRVHADTLLARATREDPAHRHLRIDTPPPVTRARAWLRANVDSDTVVIDCAGLTLPVLLFPHPVDAASVNGRSSARCKRLLSGPASATALVLTQVPAGNPSWRTAFDAGDGLLVVSGARVAWDESERAIGR